MKTLIASSFLAFVTAQLPLAAAQSHPLESAPPVVVQTHPVAGVTEVSPGTPEIQVTFSKLMQDGSWSWSTWSQDSFPEMTGQPRYLPDGRTCVLPVRLQPGKFYALWLNSEKFNNFKDATGRPAVPYLLTFTTAGASGAATQPPSEVIAQAVQTISQSAEGDPRIQEAMSQLRSVPSSQLLPGLVSHLGSPTNTIRRAAVYALWKGGFNDSAAANAPLHKLLAHSEDLTRGMAALALGQNHASESFEALARMTREDQSGYARRCAAYALGLMGDLRAEPVLKAALTDPEAMVAQNARAALELLKPAGGAGAAATESPETAVREAALRFLTAMATRDDRTLKKLSRDVVTKGWAEAVSHFADEIRVRLTESGVGLEPLQRIDQVLMAGDLAAVRTVTLEKQKAYLALFFSKTPDGWRNSGLRNAPSGMPLSECLQDWMVKNKVPKLQQ